MRTWKQVTLSVAAAALFVTVMTLGARHNSAKRAVTSATNEQEVIIVDGNHVHVFRDEKRDTTCYVFVSSISCVKDGANR